MKLYLAGDSSGFPEAKPEKMIKDYNVLLSYMHPTGPKGVDLVGKVKREFMGDSSIFLAGNSRGFSEELVPEKMIREYNILLSYMHPDGPKGIDRIVETKRDVYKDIFNLTKILKDDSLNEDEKVEQMDLYFAGSENIGSARREKFMELYLVGPEKENIMNVVTLEIKMHMLFNFLDGKRAVDKYKEQIKPKKLFVDSGAFSAWTRGKEIDVDEYISWINERSDYIDLYGQIDKIPGDIKHGHTQEQVLEAAEKTWENYLYMRERMNNPDGLLYTFHVGEPYRFLEQALEWTDKDGKHIPYIALGGMVGKSMPIKKQFLESCFSIIKKSSNPDVKTHAFGMTSFSLLKRYPITSADSTSWIMTGANGAIMTDVGIVAVSDQKAALPSHYSHLPIKHQDKFNELISEFGFTLDELRSSRDNRIMFNARYMSKKVSELEYSPAPKQHSLF